MENNQGWDSISNNEKKIKQKLEEIFRREVRKKGTDEMLDIILTQEKWTPELVDGVKNKILTLCQN